ncbi:hypothetical protein ERW51_17050 [Aliivibrio finisterrensis]|uniref:hypothetical protein n=1 Tax=Aliivibrio finisterrensis TaxID=511998 RepID=UPI00101FFF2A|nr:hypothetical protein [Aliivibrio finisterrensis]RYU64635.1 hypothetical protein ERW54_17555 [Aliivibrio finisterrensis]RYU67970.1 hypothetical protein ERW51_17050 [Aliivibrio finisterrensis]RYU71464.1 hypothetical protein ERW48_17485 [Aliivibrio finisterrensis]
MTTLKTSLLTTLLLMSISIAKANDHDIGLELSVETMFFLNDSENTDLSNSSSSLTIQPNYRHSWDFGNKVLDVRLFHREDANDGHRSHSDIRELSWTQSIGDIEYKIGISKEFWGVAESHSLVDVINQIDYVEDLDYQSRLGQPMIKVSYFSDIGSFSAWVLPYFRERNFASNKSRAFSGKINVEEESSQFYSKKEEKHVDYALRYAHTLGDIDLGIGYFQGTGRNPILNYEPQSNTLIPFYDQLRQASVDVQWTGDSLLLKAEALYRDEATFGSSNAAITGFEYTFFDLFNGHDLGLISEYLYDSLGKTRTSFDNDLFSGIRYTFNDIEATEILVGGFVDLEDGTQVFRMEVQQRITSNWKYDFIVQTFNHVDDNDLFFAGVQNDDYVRMNLRYYF